MNVYDFDDTIFHPNCTVKFALWCAAKHPGILFTYLPRVLKDGILYKMGKIPGYRFFRTVYSFLTMVPDFDEQIEAFWDKNEKNISAWYLAQKKSTDLIISGSPECIVKPIADRLGVNLKGTLYDPQLGVLYGNLMLARSKARFVIDMGLPVIDNFYSDSLSDTPIALCAEHAFLVTKKATTPIPWPEISDKNREIIKKKIDLGWKNIDD